MRLQDNERLVEYVNLFVSVLICFPEVGKICYHRAMYSALLLC